MAGSKAILFRMCSFGLLRARLFSLASTTQVTIPVIGVIIFIIIIITDSVLLLFLLVLLLLLLLLLSVIIIIIIILYLLLFLLLLFNSSPLIIIIIIITKITVTVIIIYVIIILSLVSVMIIISIKVIAISIFTILLLLLGSYHDVKVSHDLLDRLYELPRPYYVIGDSAWVSKDSYDGRVLSAPKKGTLQKLPKQKVVYLSSYDCKSLFAS